MTTQPREEKNRKGKSTTNIYRRGGGNKGNLSKKRKEQPSTVKGEQKTWGGGFGIYPQKGGTKA